MAVNKSFELRKLEREIKRNGISFTYWRRKQNSFGEPSNEFEYLTTITGMYHEFTAHMTDTVVLLTGAENGVTRTKKVPQCLTRYDDLVFTGPDGEPNSIKIGDIVEFNHRVLKVTGMQNIMEWNMIVDVSFEEVDDGTDDYIRRQPKPDKDQTLRDGCSSPGTGSGLHGSEGQRV